MKQLWHNLIFVYTSNVKIMCNGLVDIYYFGNTLLSSNVYYIYHVIRYIWNAALFATCYNTNFSTSKAVKVNEIINIYNQLKIEAWRLDCSYQSFKSHLFSSINRSITFSFSNSWKITSTLREQNNFWVVRKTSKWRCYKIYIHKHIFN